MRKLIAALAMAGLAGLTACAPASEAPAPASTAPASGNSVAKPSKSASAGASTGALGVKESCERFNSLVVDLRAVKAEDSDGYDDIYFRAQEAKDAATGDIKGLFAAVSMLALDRSLGETPSKQSQDAIRDAVFANAGECTAEDVTLTY
ncbi:hypothetical protein [Arthrobacter sp. CJ23]|uniref:hypothetical protein n=1 Tax=Arthrobacter sp. CJ23 TaxID=2972479 RepID=UPI00215D13DC|nr:hypothetical protein [Arthrobacter sp. CJ23]UVJ39216.1 hypothetical protein NVV90_18755 [Arthrobacter sp. CJ23]